MVKIQRKFNWTKYNFFFILIKKFKLKLNQNEKIQLKENILFLKVIKKTKLFLKFDSKGYFSNIIFKY